MPKLIRSWTMMLAVLLASRGLAQTDSEHPDLKSLEELTRQHHWVLLLDHYFLFGNIRSPFVLVRDGVAQEFPADAKYHDPKIHKVSIPRLSPDAKSIAYIGFDGRSWQLNVIDLGSHNTLSFDLGEEGNSVEGWSPDGSQIAVAGRHNLVFVDLASKSIVRKVEGEGWESLSPDWKHAMTWKERKGPNQMDGAPELFLVDLANGERKYLVDGWYGSWSPQGDRIAYVAASPKACLVIASAGGTPQRLFASSFFQDSSRTFQGPLVWSPDGRFLAFHREAGLKGYYHSPLIYDMQHKKRLKLPPLEPMEIVDWR